MKVIVKTLKVVGFGLFKIHLWLPAVYSLIFLVVALASSLTDAWGGYLIGLVITLLGSVALTYVANGRNKQKGVYVPEKKEQPQQSVAPTVAPPDASVSIREPAYTANGNQSDYPLYANEAYLAQSNARREILGKLYDDRFAAPERSRTQNPSRELYGEDENTRSSARQGNAPAYSLYDNDEENAPKRRGRDDAARSLYPERESARENLARTDAVGSLYPDNAPPSFQRYSGATAAAALYDNQASTQDRSFTPYKQPGVEREIGRTTVINEPEMPTMQDVTRTTTLGRRREVPVEIYATRADPNTYVYEYADRFEYIKLLEDGNKQLLKTEFKNV